MLAGAVIAVVSLAEGFRRAFVRPRQRYLRSLIQSFATEITYQVQLIQEAIANGAYWNPEQRQLPTAAWPRYPELAAEEKISPAFFATITVYQHADRLNWVARHRWAEQRATIESEAQDGLGDALAALDTAYNALLGTAAGYTLRKAG